MTLRNHFSMRTLTLSLLLTAPLLGIGCWEPELKDAEIGCGLDAYASPKCPNRPATDAGPPGPDGSGDGGKSAEAGGPVTDTAPASPDTAPINPDTTPVTPDTAPLTPDTAVDHALAPDLANPVVDAAIDRTLAPDRPDTLLADSAIDSPAGTGADLGSDSDGDDASLD